MTLKELRISKGLNQSDCAKYLGISLRTYQNYENDVNKENTTKYKAFCEKIIAFDSYLNKSIKYEKIRLLDNELNPIIFNETVMFNTNVVTNTGISKLTQRVSKYKKRDCFSLLEQFINEDYDGKICILYGLRRTGKTTLLFQMMNELPISKTAYIKIKVSDNMSLLTKDLNILYRMGYKYIFIDEITLMNDFINTAAILSDIFALMGMKIIVSGTDSLGFAMANRDELYDRSIMIHTSFISFKEYSRLLNINSIDKYIEYGGTLKIENMSFNDPDSTFDEVSFRDDESTRKYIDSSISRNIQHTLKNDHYGEYFNQLRELYDKGELTNVINRIVESMNHQFLLSVVTDEFKSHDLGSSRQLLLHEYPNSRAHILYDIDEKKVVDRLKLLIDVKEKNETSIEVTQIHIDKIKNYLQKLDLLVTCTERYEGRGESSFYIITQPGMRYAISKALVYSLMQDTYFQFISEKDKEYIIDKILNDVKGRMLEDIVLLEKDKSSQKNEEVFKFKFDNGGEYDMVIYNRETNTCRIYEIKHSLEINEKQTRHLKDIDKCKLVENRFGKIVGKYVLYRGQNKIVDDIKYLNLEQYLCE